MGTYLKRESMIVYIPNLWWIPTHKNKILPGITVVPLSSKSFVVVLIQKQLNQSEHCIQCIPCSDWIIFEVHTQKLYDRKTWHYGNKNFYIDFCTRTLKLANKIKVFILYSVLLLTWWYISYKKIKGKECIHVTKDIYTIQ